VSAFVVGEDHARNDGFNARLSARLDDVDASVLVATVGGLPAEFRRRLLQTGPRRRHAHMVGITDAMMQQSMRADYDEVHAIGERLRARFTPECSLKVETTAGTNLVVRTHPQHKWHNASGLLRGPGWANLPGGEVFTTPLTVDGLLVPDGGAFLPGGEDLSRGGRLRLRFARGILIQVEGPGADAFEDALRDTTNAMRVGQVGFGTNTSLLTSVGSLLQDLKMPGLHLSLGYTCGELTGATWTSAMEIPLLMRRPDVVLDETPLMVRGRYARGIGPD
jgi:leucyl aminopeptidase (aminopeptidase T)